MVTCFHLIVNLQPTLLDNIDLTHQLVSYYYYKSHSPDFRLCAKQNIGQRKEVRVDGVRVRKDE